MRITIETESRDPVSVETDGKTQSLDVADAIDGGGPPPELVELLTTEGAEEGSVEGPAEGYAGEAYGAAGTQEGYAPLEPDDAGPAPDWLVGVIEGAPPVNPAGPADD